MRFYLVFATNDTHNGDSAEADDNILEDGVLFCMRMVNYVQERVCPEVDMEECGNVDENPRKKWMNGEASGL
jgi:hypothetical protein